MKKLVAGLLVLTMVISLSACGKSNNNKESIEDTNNIIEDNTIKQSDLQNKDRRLRQNIQVNLDSNTLKVSQEFTRALYGSFDILEIPNIKVQQIVTPTVGENIDAITTYYAYLDKNPISSNYIIYNYEDKNAFLYGTDYINVEGRDLISSYDTEILEASKNINNDILLRDCYLGCPIYLESGTGIYEWAYPVLAVYKDIENYNIAFLGMIMSTGFVEIDTDSFELFNRTNHLLLNSDNVEMTGLTLSYDVENNIVYLENLGINNCDMEYRLDITYPWQGSTSDWLE